MRYEEINAKNQALIRQMQEIKTLRGLLPICSHCKKIRNDKGYWESIEKYVQEHSEAYFSHGLCFDCIRLLYPDIPLEQLRDIPVKLPPGVPGDLQFDADGSCACD